MRKKSKIKRVLETPEEKSDIPIPNLPEKYLWMHVNSGTKIRNVLNYAFKEFSGYNSIVWSGAGQGIGKVVTCAELCKKRYPGLHQLSKLRYIKSKRTVTKEAKSEEHRVPELHVLLSKDALDSNEPGYQSSDEQGLFSARKSGSSTVVGEKTGPGKLVGRTSSKLSDAETAEFAAMGLRMLGRKRGRKDQSSSEPLETKCRKKMGTRDA